MKDDLQRLVERFRQQRDGCKVIAADYAAKAAGPEVWDQPGNERRARVYEQYHETYRDVVEELEAVFPWLKPEETETTAGAAPGNGEVECPALAATGKSRKGMGAT